MLIILKLIFYYQVSR